MSRDQTGWSSDPARTQKGIVPPGLAGAPEPQQRQDLPYRLGARLGSSGEVYEAESAIDSTPAVVKVFRFAAGLDADSVSAFTTEARTVADLRHPHIVQMLHGGTFDDGTPFMVMERLSGETLEARLARRERMTAQEALPILRGVASALSAAHRAGVVHRELRADNVFMAELPAYEGGFVKVLDFGVSRLTAAARAAGRIVGPRTAGGLAPEQRQRSVDVADERTDEYALAALTYRMLTGREISPGTSRAPVFERATGAEEGELSPAYARCPPQAEEVLLKALKQEPESRFGSVAAFFAALQAGLAENAGPVAPPDPGRRPEVVPRAVAANVVTIKGHDTATDDPMGGGSAAGGKAPARDEYPQPTRRPRGGTSPTVRLNAPRGIPPSAAGSLTEQFFLAGEQHEASQRAGSAAVDDDDLVDAGDSKPTRFESFHSLPRTRAPLIVAAACALVALAIIAWAFAGGEPDQPFVSKAPPASAPAQVQAQPSPAPSTPPPMPAMAPPAEARGLPAPAAISVPMDGPRPPEGARPPEERAPRTRLQPPVETAPAAVGPAAPGTAGAAESATKGPLRGYVWSERRRRLVRARAADAPTDSGPPPPVEQQTPSSRDLLPPKF